MSISIHAPAKGATGPLANVVWAILVFQSTHPRRVRPDLEYIILHFSYFNPRTREGCDQI